jgi:4-alpha-glucanotransferase
MTEQVSLPSPRSGRGGPSALRRLAETVGIVNAYLDQTGREKRVTTDETRVALLTAIGFDASSDERAAESLAALRRAERGEVLSPVRVVRQSDPEMGIVTAQLPARAKGGRWSLELTTDTRQHHRIEGSWVGVSALQITLPTTPPLGYHQLRLDLTGGGREWRSEQTLIVVPERCVAPHELLNDDRVFGLTANLYTVRSAHNWGVGDLHDLADLATWAGSYGAEFLGINPLHALLNRGVEISPYSPISRLFRNPIYIDIGSVPELRYAPAVAERLSSAEFQAELAELRDGDVVRYEQIAAVKGLALDALYRVFAQHLRGRGNDRARAFDAYVREQGAPLTTFATWMAIAEERGRVARSQGGGGGAGATSGSAFDWRSWPEALRDPSSPAVAQFAARQADRVDFHRWVQFELDRQLGVAAQRAREARMRIGLYQDLAIGSSPGGADSWAFRDLFVHDISVGAPPDPYSSVGQNWGFPPISPRALRNDSYRYFVQLVRTGLRHAGALRIDHILGLFRLFWIPQGATALNGAYVRYPTDDLLGILALESVRHRALIVGEDLGTVPAEVPRALDKWGVLSSKVLLFERDRRTGFKPAQKYPELALATANTHDMPPLVGYWSERDIDMRHRLGLLSDDEAAASARRERQADLSAMLRRLTSDKILPRLQLPRSGVELRAAVHDFLCSTPSRLVGFALDDLTGESDPVNVPGVGPDRYASWSRKMHMSLEEIRASADVLRALRCQQRR